MMVVNPRGTPPNSISPRAFVFPVPDAGFNPLTASDALLVRYGLPPRPDARTHPASFRFWQKLFTPLPQFKLTILTPQQPVPARTFPPTPIAASTRHQRSLNWSGAYITPRDGRRVTEIKGSWRVPAVTRPTGGLFTREHRSSTWIGLDGQRKYWDSSLPQIGTEHRIPSGTSTPTYLAWVQWWVRGLDTQPDTIELDVQPGDEIMCHLTVIDATTARFLIENRTQNVLMTAFDVPSPVLTPPGAGMPRPMDISGATAEWVMERPTPPGSLDPFPLTDYGTVNFTEAVAISAPAPGDPGREETLYGARLIDMYEIRTSPHRTAVKSVASRPGPEAAKAEYVL